MNKSHTKTLSPFECWMLKPAIIKRLQVFLALSLVFNCLFIYQITQANKPICSKPAELKTGTIISDDKLKSFINDYLSAFFGVDTASLEFIKKHSEAKLFTQNLEAEILARQKKNIKSKFQVIDFYLDRKSETSATSFISGIEIFENQEYQNRNYFIEFNIDTDKLIITNIPKFQIKS